MGLLRWLVSGMPSWCNLRFEVCIGAESLQDYIDILSSMANKPNIVMSDVRIYFFESLQI